MWNIHYMGDSVDFTTDPRRPMPCFLSEFSSQNSALKTWKTLEKVTPLFLVVL